MHGDVLTEEDYRLLVQVLETVDQAPDLTTFKRALARALRHWFGCRAVAVTHGGSLSGSEHEGEVIFDGYSPRFLDEYEDRWTALDPLRSRQTHQLLAERGVVTINDLRRTATVGQHAFIDDFLRPNGITNKFSVRVDCEPRGAVYFVVVPDDDRTPMRTTALLKALRRHLTPIAGWLLANDHSTARQPSWQLTAREHQVAALVADGMTNLQIAERLVVGVDTVKKHLTRVLTETECDSRTQLAVQWHQRSALTVRPRQLPPDTGRFIGRAVELVTLDALLAARDRGEPTIAAVEGMAGMGKTALVVHWASRRRDAFDLDLFIDLKGCAETDPVAPADALSMLLSALGVPSAAIPTEFEQRSALLRSTLSERGRPLVVLDNAKDTEQVRPLLPALDGVVLVTSRTQLRGLVAREGATRVPLYEYTEREAIELLTATVGQARVDAEPDAATQLVELCDRLPLAVALAAERTARADHLPLATLARELSDERNRLRMLSYPSDPRTDLSATLSLSMRALRPPAARVLRLLGRHTGTEFGAESVATLCDVSPDEAATALDELVTAHLLRPIGQARFRLPGLVHSYLRNLVDEAAA